MLHGSPWCAPFPATMSNNPTYSSKAVFLVIFDWRALISCNSLVKNSCFSWIFHWFSHLGFNHGIARSKVGSLAYSPQETWKVKLHGWETIGWTSEKQLVVPIRWEDSQSCIEPVGGKTVVNYFRINWSLSRGRYEREMGLVLSNVYLPLILRNTMNNKDR